MTRSLSQLFCLRKRTAQHKKLQKYKGALPYELVERIIVDAWCSIGDAPARWRFFRTIAILSKIWRDVLHEVVLRYVFIETMIDFVAYERLLSRYDPCARYVSIVLNAVDHTRFRVDEIAKHVPEARFMCLAITIDRRYYFDAILQNLLAKTESLTHLRICWPPLRDSAPSISITWFYPCVFPQCNSPSLGHTMFPEEPCPVYVHSSSSYPRCSTTVQRAYSLSSSGSHIPKFGPTLEYLRCT
ncbi:hypothetical protein BDR03DRAFT_22420 [Suillus americanus]|nr:hypothetical protein BDR03DRAFT_22420 [Suillus americanus]